MKGWHRSTCRLAVSASEADPLAVSWDGPCPTALIPTHSFQKGLAYMLCTPAILKRALDHYQSYLPTASEHLRETREKWIPIVVKRPRDRRRVCQISEHILQRGLSNTGPITWSTYNGLPETRQIAVALNVMQAMAEHLASLPTASRSAGGQPLPMVQGVGQFLAAIPLDHATLALRNCGPRELGGSTSTSATAGKPAGLTGTGESAKKRPSSSDSSRPF